MNKIERMKSHREKVKTVACEAIMAYIDYMVDNGATKVNIKVDKGFSIFTDNVLPKEKMESKEFQTLVYNLYKALAK